MREERKDRSGTAMPMALKVTGALMLAFVAIACAETPAEAPAGASSATAQESTATPPETKASESQGDATASATPEATEPATTAQEPAKAVADTGVTGPKIDVKLDNGKSFQLQLDEKNTPKTTEGIVALVKKGFYDGQHVHRVVPEFVVQWGDPLSKNGADAPGVGSGGTGKNLPFEPGKLSFVKGTLGMASTGRQLGGDCQMFVVTSDTNGLQLNGDYSAFGKVVKGMDVVMKIQQGDKIVSMKLAK